MNTIKLAIQEGIKQVGVGRKGSRALDSELIERIAQELKSSSVPPTVLGAFLAGLVMKGPTEQELSLNECFPSNILENPQAMVRCLAAEAPANIQKICQTLIQKDVLGVTEAKELGDYLFRADALGSVRGLVSSLLRVRYETPDEYEGLLQSMTATFVEGFKVPVPGGRPIALFAEPFDGVDRSYMITPLLMRVVQDIGFRVVGLCGRNSGPKFGNNLRDLAQHLGAPFMKANQDLVDDAQKFGWFIDQSDLSPALDEWVSIRQEIIKRPFLATLERFVNPCSASIMIASAFHPPYGDKMLTICERAGFPAAIIVRNGMEGTLAFPLMRNARILCTVRTPTGYVRHEIIFDANTVLDAPYSKEERLEEPQLDENVRLIQDYANHGSTDYGRFDDRVKVTCAGLTQALEWVANKPLEKGAENVG